MPKQETRGAAEEKHKEVGSPPHVVFECVRLKCRLFRQAAYVAMGVLDWVEPTARLRWTCAGLLNPCVPGTSILTLLVYSAVTVSSHLVYEGMPSRCSWVGHVGHGTNYNPCRSLAQSYAWLFTHSLSQRGLVSSPSTSCDTGAHLPCPKPLKRSRQACNHFPCLTTNTELSVVHSSPLEHQRHHFCARSSNGRNFLQPAGVYSHRIGQ